MLQSSNASAETAAADREVLLKAQQSLSEHAEEIETIRGQLSESLEIITDLRSKEALVETLQVELAETKAALVELERANDGLQLRLSEAEVEVLELRDAQEQASEELKHKSAAARELDTKLQSINEEHATALQALAAQHSQEVSALKADMEAALKSAAETAEAEKQQAHETLRLIQSDLDSQESQYDSKLDAVKAEHATLLLEAFEKAKVCPSYRIPTLSNNLS